MRYRQLDGAVGTDSAHPTRAAAQLRCKQVDIDIATDTYLDPAAGRITLGGWVDLWRQTHVAGAATMAAFHFLSDVLAGYVLGAAWLAAMVAAFGVRRVRRVRPRQRPCSRTS